MWLLPHVEIPGNEKADSLANVASTYPSCSRFNSMPLSETFNSILIRVKEEWQKYWTNLPLSNQLRNIKLNIKKMEIHS